MARLPSKALMKACWSMRRSIRSGHLTGRQRAYKGMQVRQITDILNGRHSQRTERESRRRMRRRSLKMFGGMNE